MEPTPPNTILDLAASCVRFVQRSVGIELDFTSDTLPLLDHYLSEVGEPKDPEVLGLVAPAAGAYFGEVVRRSLGPAEWHVEGEDYAGYRLQFRRCFLYFNPIGQALEAVRGEAVEGFRGHLGLRAEDTRTVKAALERLGDVRSDDYYRLATRFEVIEQVVATLVGQGIASGELARGFEAQDYTAAIAEMEAAERQNGHSRQPN